MEPKTFKAFCPLVKGVCLNGFVKGVMPENEETGERTKCAFFLQLAGQDPQTGETINDPGCSITFLPIINLEGNQHMRQCTASTDKVATGVAKHTDLFATALATSLSKGDGIKRIERSETNGRTR